MKQNKCLKIEGMDHQGRGIAHSNDKIIFVNNALIGEEVEIKILKEKKNIIEAESANIIKASNDRVISSCPYFKECGGCDLLHISYKKQLEYKENKVKEIIKKFAGIENIVSPIIENDEPFEYRNKVIFQVDKKIGFYQKKSNKIVEIGKCLLLDVTMNQILSIIRNNMDLNGIKQVMIRNSKRNKNTMIVFVVEQGFQNSKISSMLKEYSVLVKRNGKYEQIYGNNCIIEKVGKYEFKISPESFFQVNTKQMEKLYQTVLEHSDLTGNENVLDLYCGTGTIGIFLSSKANKVLGIEISIDAIKDANINKEKNQINNIEFLCGDTGTVLKKTNFKADLVIVDPPRAGLDENAIVELRKISAPKIIYVSCDPVTLARDIKRLENEYEVNTIIPVDMFSNTYHVECVCVLNRR